MIPNGCNDDDDNDDDDDDGDDDGDDDDYDRSFFHRYVKETSNIKYDDGDDGRKKPPRVCEWNFDYKIG